VKRLICTPDPAMPGLTELLLSTTRIRPSPFRKRVVYSNLLRAIEAPKPPRHPSRLLAALQAVTSSVAALAAPLTKNNGTPRK
jgi:hypothetical protein